MEVTDQEEFNRKFIEALEKGEELAVNKRKQRVTFDDVVCLASDLGLLESDIDDFGEKAYDELLYKIDVDPEGFMEKYTKALLDHIEVGSSNLTGKEEHYKGFGKRINDTSVEMFLKTSR